MTSSGPLEHPARRRLAHPYAGHLKHLIVEAGEVLDVHGPEHIDSGGKQQVNVLPAFLALRPRVIRVRKFIHDGLRT
jgi:hypothetical protein